MFNPSHTFNPFATNAFAPSPFSQFNGFGWNPQFAANTAFNTAWTPWTTTNASFNGNTPWVNTPWNNFSNTPWSATPWTNWTNNSWTNNSWTGNPWTTTPFNGFTGFSPWNTTSPVFASTFHWNNSFGFTPWTNPWQNAWGTSFTPWTNGFTNSINPTFNNGFTPNFQQPFTPTWASTNFGQGNFPFNGGTNTGNPVTIDGSDRTGRRGVNFARDAA